MTETAHTRSRNASLGGLMLQLVAFGGALALSFATNSLATQHLAWYLLGGAPIWLVALLVFRQRELAALEALDLEELRREKQSTGGGEAMFDEDGGAGLGFRVAEARLHWMQRWFVSSFGLLTAAYLGLMGIYLWRKLVVFDLGVGSGPWPELTNVPVALVVLAIVMLGTFLFSRYASGMGRVKRWQLLRGCGSFMLGNALITMALLVCLGVQLYAGVKAWEQALAYIIPFLMIVLAIETLINFVADVYRPRAPGVEPRAAFDSRLLGLFAEPGGIASSIADAINYQFGFQVSHTWFYKLLERTFVPLIATGALALWLLTCVVVVQPYEHVIVERFGRQLNAEDPLRPGLHFKLPWPIDVARPYNTGQLHQITVGYKQFDAVPVVKKDQKPVLLWTDVTHYDLEHFDFLTCPTKGESQDRDRQPAETTTADPQEDATGGDEQPVNLIRMDVAVQYRIRPDKLDVYTNAMDNPHRAMLDIAWEEIGRYTASSTVEFLLGRDLAQVGREMRRRISERVRDLGLEVVYVGVTNAHPEKTVAEAYRNVVQAEQEKIAAIREARVTENQRLSAVAGEARWARTLADAVERARQANEDLHRSMQILGTTDPAVVEELATRLLELEPLFRRCIEANARLDRMRERRLRVERDFKLGLGQTFRAQSDARQAAEQTRADEQAAAAALEQQLAPLRAEAVQRFDQREDLARALIENVSARVARAVWDEKLEREFTQARLAGEAAEKLAGAFAERWKREMDAAAKLITAQNERAAYRAAPEVYKTRRLIEVLVEGVKDARKFFLAFDPGQRLVRVRFVTEDEPQTDILNLRRPNEP